MRDNSGIHALHCLPKVPTEIEAQLSMVVNCSFTDFVLAYFPVSLPDSATGASWAHVPNKLLALES